MRKATLKHFIAANAAVFAMVAAPAVIDHFYGTDLGWMPSAYAGDSVPKGQAGKPEGKGHMGKGGPSQDVGGSGSGQGGPSADSDAKGPRYGGAGAGGSDRAGGKPVWAQEGIPEVELGRLNVARAPQSVSDRQLAEALKAIALDPTLADFYDSVAYITDPATNLDNVLRLDSPLANLAILKTLLTTKADISVTDAKGDVVATIPYTTDALAILLGSASDKTVPISQDTVYAIFKILTKAEPSAEYNLQTIAEAAESVRVNILEDHDN